MTMTLQHTHDRRSSAILAITVIALSATIIVGAWLLGAAAAPDQQDAAAVREVAFEQAYDDARADAYGPAYQAAWEQAMPIGAAAGRSEGARTGAAAGRRAAAGGRAAS